MPLFKKKKAKAPVSQPKEAVFEGDIFSILEKKINEYNLNTIIPTPEPEPLYEDYELDIPDETSSAPQYENYDNEIVKEEVVVPAYSYDDEYSAKNSKITEIDIQPMVSAHSHDYDIKYNWEIEEDIDEFEFDPAKAIIYSEIMKRPAYS